MSVDSSHYVQGLALWPVGQSSEKPNQGTILISLQDFENYCDRLDKMDWYFEFSDDSRVYRTGLAKRGELVTQSFQHPLLGKAYDLYSLNKDGLNRSELRAKANELKAEFLITA